MDRQTQRDIYTMLERGMDIQKIIRYLNLDGNDKAVKQAYKIEEQYLRDVDSFDRDDNACFTDNHRNFRGED